VLSVGASLSLAATGFNTAGFAPRATKVLVNVDPGELVKPLLKVDLPIAADAREFLEVALRESASPAPRRDRWLLACADWKARYPVLLPEASGAADVVDTYLFADRLSDLLGPDDVVVTGISLDACSIFQSFRVKRGQRV